VKELELPIRFLCRIGWHRWGRWNGVVDGYYATQTRHCLACGIAKTRRAD